MNFPLRVQYTLSRSQRLIPHLSIWGPIYSLFLVVLLGFFVLRAAIGIWQLDALAVLVFGGLAVGLFLFCRDIFVGLIDVILVPVRQMDLTIEENAIGVLIGAERWYLFLDGVTDIRKYRDDVWTLQYWNGMVLHISAFAINEEQIEHIRAAMDRGRTPEGVQAIIERGRRIREIMEEESKK